MQVFYKKNIAFTLAEVLITLGVIGVVAALTIPTLTKNITNKQFETAFRENYALLKQASAQIINDNGGNLANAYADPKALLDAYASKLKVQKTCTNATAVGDCWASTTYRLNGTSGVAMSPASYSIVLINGTVVQVDSTGGWYQSDCLMNWYTGNGSTGVCAMINIDINGMKGPNTMGRDIFQFYQPNASALIPNGSPGTDDYVTGGWDYCDPTSSDWYNGIACGGRILVKGGMDY